MLNYGMIRCLWSRATALDSIMSLLRSTVPLSILLLLLETVNLNNVLICIKTTCANYSCKIKCFQDFKGQVPHLAHSGFTRWRRTHLSTFSVQFESNQWFLFTGQNWISVFPILLIKKILLAANFRNDSSEDFPLIVSFGSEIKISALAVECLAAWWIKLSVFQFSSFSFYKMQYKLFFFFSALMLIMWITWLSRTLS